MKVNHTNKEKLKTQIKRKLKKETHKVRQRIMNNKKHTTPKPHKHNEKCFAIILPCYSKNHECLQSFSISLMQFELVSKQDWKREEED
jgi:predicted Ser/Thr protein kinase